MIVKDNLLKLRGLPQRGLRGVAGYPHLRSFGRFGAEPWEYQPIEPGDYVRTDTPSAEQYTAPVWEPEPYNHVSKESANVGYETTNTSNSQPSQVFNWTGIIDILGGVVKGFTQTKQPTVVVQQKSALPSWLLPVAITGGAGLLAVAVLAKPKRSSLGSYRRRRSRRSRR